MSSGALKEKSRADGEALKWADASGGRLLAPEPRERQARAGSSDLKRPGRKARPE
jgi:hypothetical protein